MKSTNLKERLYIVIFEADTPAGKLFDVLLFIAIMTSVGLTMLSSVLRCSSPSTRFWTSRVWRPSVAASA